MHVKKTLLIAVSLFVALSFGREFYAMPNSNNTAVYPNKVRGMNEEAVASVGKDDRLRVIETSGSHYKVETPDGTRGWLEGRLVTKTEETVQTFENMEISGYGDNPTPIIIQDADMGASAPIEIDRSFKSALLQNTDKDMVSRVR